MVNPFTISSIKNTDLELNKFHHGHALDQLRLMPDKSVHCIVTSPPYWGLRNYGVDQQLGMENTPEGYIQSMLDVFMEAHRVLRNDGTFFLNLGDTYMGGKGQNGASQAYRERHPGIKVINQKALINTAPGVIRPNDRPHKVIKPKELVGIPWRMAIALSAAGWFLRQDIIWHKPNPMPESIKDRCTKSHEYIFMFSKGRKYYFDAAAIQEKAIYGGGTQAGMDRTGFKDPRKFNGKHRTQSTILNPRQDYAGVDNGFRNKRSVWTIPLIPFKAAHFATFPEKLPQYCILAGCPVGGTVLDMFSGAGTTALVARLLGRNFYGIELNPKYIKIADRRLANDPRLKQLGLFL